MKNFLVANVLAFSSLFSGQVFADTGIVRYFSVQKGFGYIIPLNPSKPSGQRGPRRDIFLHISKVKPGSLGLIQQGACVSYEAESRKSGYEHHAVDVEVISCVN